MKIECSLNSILLSFVLLLRTAKLQTGQRWACGRGQGHKCGQVTNVGKRTGVCSGTGADRWRRHSGAIETKRSAMQRVRDACIIDELGSKEQNLRQLTFFYKNTI